MELDEMVERDLTGYSDFGYWGDRPLFETWGIWKSQALTPDSSILCESNWAEILKQLKEIEPEGDNWEIFQASHWACGWVDQIMYNTECTAIVEKLVELESSIEDYPILDEDDLSERECEATQKYWNEMDLSERVEMCSKQGDSIFSARHDYIPDNCNMYIQDCCIN